MKMHFTIEWPDDCGPGWMNKDNLQLCLDAYCKPGICKASDCQEVERLRAAIETAKDQLSSEFGTVAGAVTILARCAAGRGEGKE